MSRGPRRRQGGPPRQRQGGARSKGASQGAGTHSKGEKRGVGGDQIEGRHAVRELLLAERRRTREVFMASGMDSAPILQEIADLADGARVPVREIARTKFEKMTRTEGPQGVMAKADPLPSLELDDILASSDRPFILAVDGVTDPGNLGALLRTAECAGVTAVLLPRHRAAHITPTVAKAAAGAVEHLPIAVVTGMAATMRTLTDNGIWTIGLDMAGGQEIYDLDMGTEAVALVVGAEGKGLSKLVRERCDVVVRVPMVGSLNSLNVAAAGAVACFEIARRRHQ